MRGGPVKQPMAATGWTRVSGVALFTGEESVEGHTGAQPLPRECLIFVDGNDAFWCIFMHCLYFVRPQKNLTVRQHEPNNSRNRVYTDTANTVISFLLSNLINELTN